MDRDYVLQKLAEKKKLDPGCRAFGVERHRYRLQPTIAEHRVAEIEEQLGVDLPRDYRDFLINVSNGGAGPGYGLYSLEGSLLGHCDTFHEFSLRPVGEEITRPFIRPDEDTEETPYEERDGNLMLCQHGCANDDFLIVTGAERGYVWHLMEYLGQMVPVWKQSPEPERDEEKWIASWLAAPPEQKMTFSDWYQNWLERPPKVPRFVIRRSMRGG